MATQWWAPDDHLVTAVLAGSTLTMDDLAPADRCWLVAGLITAGLTAEDIRDRMRCSLRSVRAIRAEPMTELARLMQNETSHFGDELRLARSELARERTTRRDAEAENARLRGQLDRLVATMTGQEPRCSEGHLMDRYNTYVQASTGRRWCRQCHRDRQRAYRARVRERANRDTEMCHVSSP